MNETRQNTNAKNSKTPKKLDNTTNARRNNPPHRIQQHKRLGEKRRSQTRTTQHTPNMRRSPPHPFFYLIKTQQINTRLNIN